MKAQNTEKTTVKDAEFEYEELSDLELEAVAGGKGFFSDIISFPFDMMSGLFGQFLPRRRKRRRNALVRHPGCIHSPYDNYWS